MAELDRETVDRAALWCAQAERPASRAAIRAALAGLHWDELLAVRALLADPPPARPLGPYALADLARGATPDQAARRERDGRYPESGAPASTPSAAGASRDAAPSRSRSPRQRPGSGPVIRRKAAGPAPLPASPRPLPLLDELLLPAGRNALERLARRLGGRRVALLAALATSHRRADGEPLAQADLDRLLDHHGLARTFLRRERDETLHAVRAAGGLLSASAAALGLDGAGLAAALRRLDLEGEVERLRAARRDELTARATLSERARLLVSEAERLADLGLLAGFQADLSARLPEHLRALRASREPLALALARSLSLPVGGVRELATRLGLELGPVTAAEAAAADLPAPPDRPRRPGSASGPPRGPAGRRDAPGRARAGGTARPDGAAPRSGRPGGAPPREGRAGGRPSPDGRSRPAGRKPGLPAGRPGRPGDRRPPAAGGGQGGRGRPGRRPPPVRRGPPRS